MFLEPAEADHRRGSFQKWWEIDPINRIGVSTVRRNLD